MFTGDKFNSGITPTTYLKSFNTGENEQTLLRFAGDHESGKEDLQILGMIMYIYMMEVCNQKRR